MRKLLLALIACAVLFNFACVRPEQSNREGQTSANTNTAQATVSDEEITAQAKLALLADSRTSGFATEIDTRGGVVTLTGTVDSEETKAAAAAIVRNVQGVRDVNNQLQVAPEAKQPEVSVSDDKIKEEIEKLVDSDDKIAPSLSILPQGGVVRLSGEVDTSDQKVYAVQAIRKLPGVKSVDASGVVVKGEPAKR
ncbi:MAG TPA: BON domain-containing protein [Blastocatellia bacterium]|nr:BON domain-containing protein [Blastocatellia bacterium]